MGSKNLRLAELASNVSAAGEYTEAAGVVVYNTIDSLPTLGNAAGDVAFIDSSNLLYIYSGEGWYNIGLVNQSPTITSGGAGSYNLATDGTPTVITLIGSDPDGFPITWSFTTSGLDSEATVVQGTGDSSNIFTITPSTDTTKAGTFSVTFTASDGINIATDVNSFTLSFGDTNLGEVIALLQTDKDPNNQDISNNNFLLTKANAPATTSFTPFLGSYYSNYFDGSDDYLTVADDASLEFGSSEFTIEMWLYALSSGQTGIFSTRVDSSAYGPLNLDYNSGTLRLLSSSTGNSWHDISGGSISLNTNQWNHIAITREVNTLKIWANGALSKSISVSGALMENTAGLAIGSRITSGGGVFPGYISNFRFVKGTALYTAAFTPPTSPLTTTSQGATASEVSLLTCQSSRFIDNSTNSHTITVIGATYGATPAVSGHVPFAFDSTSTKGSAYFNGSTGEYTILDNSNLQMGSGDFTIEGWFYPLSSKTGTPVCVYSKGVNTSGGIILAVSSDYIIMRHTGQTDSYVNISVPQMWNHIVWQRNGSVVEIYLNGTKLGVTNPTINSTLNDTASSYLGSISSVASASNRYGGYVSNFRIIKGSTLYSGNSITVPSSPLTAVSGTQLLTFQNIYPNDNVSVGDRSGGEMPLTINGDINTSSFSPYSPFGYSNYFDGTGDYLTIPANDDFVFGSEDFTVEAWIHPTVSGAYEGIVNNWQTGGAFIFRLNSSGQPEILYYTTANTLKTATDTVSANEWTHVAVVRNGNNIYFYINGVADSGGAQSETGTIAYYNGAAKDLKIGTSGDTNSLWDGYISNLRIVKGTAVYTSNFTPSTTALTPTDETVLLTCQSPSFIDNGKKKHSLTRYGDARVTPYAPFKGHTITPNTYSVYLNAHTDYVQVESHTFDMSGEFTIECWVHPTNMPTQSWGIADARASGGTNAYWVIGLRNLSSAFVIEMFAASGAGYVIRGDGTTAIPLNEWSHIALTRDSSNVVTAWVNGVSQGTVTNSTNWTVSNTNLRIGQSKDAADGSYESNGAMSNFRLATTCLYTTAFTPSTTPLTAVSGTQLLTFQDATIRDNSSNELTFSTINGNIQPQEFNPFGLTTISKVEYNPTTHAGSMYGDGTTDYVDVPANAWNSVGTGDFCIQFWTYSKEVDANKGQIAVGGNKIAIRFDTSNRMTFWVAGNGGPTSTPNNTVYPFNWYHVCLERSGSTNTLYINGVARATNTTTPSNDATPIIRIGGQYADNTGYTFTGWISDVSIRSKAVYKGNFVPPKQVTYGDQTKLQVPFNDAAIYDAKSQLTYEVNSFKTSSAATKFHNQSLDFTSANDYVYTDERHGTTKVYGEQLKLGTGDFTVEFWWNFASTSGRQDLLWIGSTSTRLGILWNLNAGQLTYYPAADAISATVSFSTGTWYHIAVARASGYTKMFVDGTQVGTTYTDSKNFDGTILYLGKDSGASSSYSNGYMDGLRITKGTARYTSNFTAPTDAFSKK